MINSTVDFKPIEVKPKPSVFKMKPFTVTKKAGNDDFQQPVEPRPAIDTTELSSIG